MGLANGLPRESIGHYTGLGQRILVELNPNILVRDAIRMQSVMYNSIHTALVIICLNMSNLSRHMVYSCLDK